MKIKDKLNYRKQDIEARWGEIVDLKTISHDEFMIAYDVIMSISEIIVHVSSIIPEKDINLRFISLSNEVPVFTLRIIKSSLNA